MGDIVTEGGSKGDSPSSHSVQLTEIFHTDHPGFKAYWSFVKDCNRRFINLEPGTPYHIHHIVPRSWFRKYRPDLDFDKPWNTVCCTVEEHIMLHMVLGTILKDTQLGWAMFQSAHLLDKSWNEGKYFRKGNETRTVKRVVKRT